MKNIQSHILNVIIIIGALLSVSGVLAATGGEPMAAPNRNAQPAPLALIAPWAALSGPSGTGIGGTSQPNVQAMVFDSQNNLYVGGDFTTAGGVTVNYVARWDGTQWSALTGSSGTGVNGMVFALAVDSQDNLYVGGDFTTAGGVTVDYVAQWDGSDWSALTGPSGTGVIYSPFPSVTVVNSLAVDSQDNLYAGGRFDNAGGILTNSIAQWDGSNWSALTGPSGTGVLDGTIPGRVYALAVNSQDDLYAAGRFDTAGGINATYIAQWDGTGWARLGGTSTNGGGLSTSNIATLVIDSGDNLYVGGTYSLAENGSSTASGGALKWDGSGWEAINLPLNPQQVFLDVEDILIDSVGSLWVVGDLEGSATGTEPAYILKQNSDGSWLELGYFSFGAITYDIAISNSGQIYVGGFFDFANGVTLNAIALLNNTLLTVLIDGVNTLEDTGDGVLREGEITAVEVNILQVSFSEDLLDLPAGNDTDDATNPSNFRLVKDGSTNITINAVSYANNNGNGPFRATVVVNDGKPLPPGEYVFTVVGSTSITGNNVLGNVSLAGDGVTPGTDFQRNFTISGEAGQGRGAETDPELPATGFAPGVIAALPVQPAGKAYSDLGELRLEIPKLGVNMPIVGVPQLENGWDVSWLNNSAGWLEGTAYPTLDGNTVITGHVWDANNNPGPFANLRSLSYGDQFSIHIGVRVYTYAVERNYQVVAHDQDVLAHSPSDIVTLLTCEVYDVVDEVYLYRRVITARLVSVK